MTRRAHEPDAAASGRVRVDKWLWAARFYRTRSLAAQAVDAGQVRVDGERIKPSHPLRPGTRVSVRKREVAFDVDVLEVSERRGGAPDAAKLYRETPQSITAREALLAERANARNAASAGRPTKRDRRRLEDFLDEP